MDWVGCSGELCLVALWYQVLGHGRSAGVVLCNVDKDRLGRCDYWDSILQAGISTCKSIEIVGICLERADTGVGQTKKGL